MEKFAVDLDAVLDELEQFEIDPTPDKTVKTNNNNNHENINNPYREQSTILSGYSSSGRTIDKREADYSIQARPPKILAFDNPNYNSNEHQYDHGNAILDSYSTTIPSLNNTSTDYADLSVSSLPDDIIHDRRRQSNTLNTSSSSSSLLSLSSSSAIAVTVATAAASSSSSSSSSSTTTATAAVLSSPSARSTSKLPDLCLSKSDSTPIENDTVVFVDDNRGKDDEGQAESDEHVESIVRPSNEYCENVQQNQQYLENETHDNKCSNISDTKHSVCNIIFSDNTALEMLSTPQASSTTAILSTATFPLPVGDNDPGTAVTATATAAEIGNNCDKIMSPICDIIQDSLCSSNQAESALSDLSLEPVPSSSRSPIDVPLSSFCDNTLKEQTSGQSNNSISSAAAAASTICQPDLVTDSRAIIIPAESDSSSSSSSKNDERFGIDNLTESELDKYLSDLKEEEEEDDGDGDDDNNDLQTSENTFKNTSNNTENNNDSAVICKDLNVIQTCSTIIECNNDHDNNQDIIDSFPITVNDSLNSNVMLNNFDNDCNEISSVNESLKEQNFTQNSCNKKDNNNTEEKKVIDQELEELKQLEREYEQESRSSLSADNEVLNNCSVVEEVNDKMKPEHQQNIHEFGSAPESIGDRSKVDLIVDECDHSNTVQDVSATTAATPSSSSSPPSTQRVGGLERAGSLSEDRGGLVQNIAYFERQEMPNGLMEHEQKLGKVKPFWVPDEEAQNCLHCDVKFTLIKRRHHCRSCGKVLCSQCCNYKAKLMYLEGKESRVCKLCYEILMRIEAIERRNGRPLDISHRDDSNPEHLSGSRSSATSLTVSASVGDAATSSSSSSTTVTFPDPNNPSEYCSTISPFDQVGSTIVPPTVMVPVGVLKRRSNEPGSVSESHSIPKQVIFSDGVRPGGDLIEHGATSSRLPEDRSRNGRPQLQLKIPNKPSMEGLILKRKIKPHRVIIQDRYGATMPSIVNYHELKAIDPNLEPLENYEQLVEFLKADWLPSITFNLSKNLFVNAKLVLKDCCHRKWCWSFASRGLASVGQDEILFVLDCDSYKPDKDDKTETEAGGTVMSSTGESTNKEFDFPRDVFKLYLKVYDSASKASLFGEMSHLFFPDGLFGKKENAGFVFVLPTMQCFRNLLLPSPPALIALLIHKWEIPWVRIFPLRLVLRLGHEYNSYPTPVISDASRKSVYYEIGHTIMNVLADFRNYNYTLSTVKDLLIHVEQRKRVKMIIPKASYEQVCKVLSTSNEHVLAFGANFSGKADSHFICMQHEHDLQGEYQTAIVTLPDFGEPKITASNFIVFSGALKSTTGLKAKMNVVEDGLLVQIPAQTMDEMRTAIREMKEFKIYCCKNDQNESDEWIEIVWVNDELSTNLGVRSHIDGKNLEGVQSARIFSNPDFTNERFLIRWIEIFIIQIDENTRRSEMINTSRLAESVAQGFCVSMVEHLDQLFEAGFTKIGLRISLDADRVGYEIGSNGARLPEQFTVNLDDALLPAIIDNISTTGIENPHVIELVFHVLYK